MTFTPSLSDLGPCDLTPVESSPRTPLYIPPSPTGWKSSAVRRGPDPDFATSVRRAGRE